MNIFLFSLCILLVHSEALSQSVVKIGKQKWMSKNLDVITFRNGEQISQASNKEQWDEYSKNKIPSWCYYDFDENNGKIYGKLYNWFAVSDPRGLAPKGYHIPTDQEWTALTDFLGGNNEAGLKIKSRFGWMSYTVGGKQACPDCVEWTIEYRNKVPCHRCKDSRQIQTPVQTLSGNGNNVSVFSANPGGYCSANGLFYGIGEEGNWWSASEHSKDNAWSRNLSYQNSQVYRFGNSIDYGFSVRCVKD